MTNNIQKKLKTIGSEGCYFLCILQACNVPDERIISIYDYCVKNKWMLEDCYIENPDAIVKFLLKKAVFCYKSDKVETDALFCIARYYNDRTKYSHFVLVTDDGIWDPLGTSVTVTEGHIADYRIFRRGEKGEVC